MRFENLRTTDEPNDSPDHFTASPMKIVRTVAFWPTLVGAFGLVSAFVYNATILSKSNEELTRSVAALQVEIRALSVANSQGNTEMLKLGFKIDSMSHRVDSLTARTEVIEGRVSTIERRVRTN